MGLIYKATSKTSQQSYIGLTNISIESRWNDHIGAAFNPNHPDHNFPIHRAIRKYGVEDFIVEEIDQGFGEELKQKEKYWIKYYNTYYSGYNATLGGDGQCKYDYAKIVDYYINHQGSLKQTCQEFNIYDQVVYSALKAYNINPQQYKFKNNIKQVYKKKILLIEENLLFNCITDIDKYFNKVVHPNIRRCLNGITKKAYGYTWREIEDNEDISGFRLAF